DSISIGCPSLLLASDPPTSTKMRTGLCSIMLCRLRRRLSAVLSIRFPMAATTMSPSPFRIWDTCTVSINALVQDRLRPNLIGPTCDRLHDLVAEFRLAFENTEE